MSRRIDFFIAGVQKGGTTALDAYLRRSRSVQLPQQKELHFFDDESARWDVPDYDGLHAHFDWDVSGVRRGESTPIYTYWPNALERLQRYNSAAKVILCLRHPACRAHSHWRMERKREAETLSFESAVSEAGRARYPPPPGGVHRVFSYVDRGFYARQIRRVLGLFERGHVLFVRTDDLWSDPNGTVGRVHDFLDLPQPEPLRPEYIVPIDTLDLEPMSTSAYATLVNLYREDLVETQRLTGLRLGDWLAPGYVEPMPSPDRTLR